MLFRRLILTFLILLTFSVTVVAESAKTDSRPIQRAGTAAKLSPSKNAVSRPKNTDPNQVLELKILPSKLVLSGARDSRRVLVLGKLAGGGEIDLSRSAKFTVLDDKIQIDADGFLAPVKEGEARVRIEDRGLQVELPVSIGGLEQPHGITFVRDVMPIINKVGCTSGPCHGAAKGKNGFKLSLRGYDPRFDYQMLVHDVSGRRINRVDPARSLILAKPTMQVAHGGGVRIELDSRYYQTLLQWISQGTSLR